MLLLLLFKWGISLIKSNTWKFEANAMANGQAKCVSKYALYAYHDDDWWLYCKVNMYFIIGWKRTHDGENKNKITSSVDTERYDD